MLFTTFHTRKLRFLELNNVVKATDLVAELGFPNPQPSLPPLPFPFLPSSHPPLHPLVECPSYTGTGGRCEQDRSCLCSYGAYLLLGRVGGAQILRNTQISNISLKYCVTRSMRAKYRTTEKEHESRETCLRWAGEPL